MRSLVIQTLSLHGDQECILLHLYEFSEKDLSQVLQMRAIYTNVAQGVIAKKSDVTKAFGKADIDTICIEILKYSFNL